MFIFALYYPNYKMKQDELFVITINRELGSGGRTIGRKLAERLEVPFYDKSVIQQLKKKYNLTADEIERLKGQKHNWWAEFKRSMMMMPNFVAPQILPDYSNMPDFLITDEIFKAESEILKGIAADGSCVIAGRSGFYIFRDHPNHLSVLIQASMKNRIERVMLKQKISAEEAKAIIKQVDESRENYVNKYTGSSRYDTHNYDLVINADDHSEDEIVEIIIQYLKLPLSKIIF